MIRDVFKRNIRGIDNQCCTWISACMLVNIDDFKAATTMMEFMQKQGNDMEWLHLCRHGKDDQRSNHSSLSTYMNSNNFGCNVYHVDDSPNYVADLMNEKSTGKFVCILCDGNFSSTYAIGVDCDSNPKLIWDCCENTALELSSANLDRCCGQGTCLTSIACMVQVRKRVPRKERTKKTKKPIRNTTRKERKKIWNSYK